MLEEWVNNQGLFHLNKSDLCEGVYTYGRPGKPKSAIDHVMVNTKMSECFRGMRVGENAEELNISDHNLIRSWFKVGTSWRKTKLEERTWYSINEESLNKMEKDLEKRIRGPTSFNSMMKKIEIT